MGGSSLPSVRVEINPLQLEHYGLKLTQVAAFLKSQNAHTPTGSIADGRDHQLHHGQRSAVEGERLQASSSSATTRDAVVRLQDIADVVDGTENRPLRRLRQRPAVGHGHRLQAARLEHHRDGRPHQGAAPGDAGAPSPPRTRSPSSSTQTTTIRASLHDVERTLIISIVLVIGVVFVFLRDWRATIIPGIAVPVSLTGTFAAMYLCRFSLDNLSLIALTISTGFVIDDAIVVMENITRYIEKGMPVKEAAFTGAKEIGFTVLSITLSLIAVFIPILLMGGIVGRLFREFAVTLSAAILISMLLSLTTTPMLCSLLLKPHEETRPRAPLSLQRGGSFSSSRSRLRAQPALDPPPPSRARCCSSSCSPWG